MSRHALIARQNTVFFDGLYQPLIFDKEYTPSGYDLYVDWAVFICLNFPSNSTDDIGNHHQKTLTILIPDLIKICFLLHS